MNKTFILSLLLFSLVFVGCTNNSQPIKSTNSPPVKHNLSINNSNPIENKPLSKDEAMQIAKDWITKNSQTFLFDGIKNSLKLKNSSPLFCDGCYKFRFEFNSSHPGFGNRSNKTLENKITTHLIDMQVVNGKPGLTLIDDSYNDQANFFICSLIPEEDYSYVCGENEKTYPHPCFAYEDGIEISHNGKCNSTPSMTKELCETSGGHFNECGSACRGSDENMPCTLQCVPYCECGGFAGFTCPDGYICTDYLPGDVVDAIGICKKQS